MRRRASSARGAAAMVVAALGLSACFGSVYSDPLRHRPDGSTSSGDGAEPPGTLAPSLSGSWKACGQLGAGSPRRIAISGDGGTAAILFTGGKIAVHHLPDGALLREIQTALPPPAVWPDPDLPPSMHVHEITLSRDGGRVAIADFRHAAGWTVADGQPLFDLPGRYKHVRLSPRGDQFLVWSDARESSYNVELHHIPDGDLVHTFSPTLTAGFSEDGTQVLTYFDGVLFAAAADATGTALRQIPLGTSHDLVAFSDSGRLLAGWASPFVQVFGSDGTRRFSTAMDAERFSFSDDETRVAVLRPDLVTILDAETGDELTRVDRPQVRDVAVGRRAGISLLAEIGGVFAAGDSGVAMRFASLPGQGLHIVSVAVSPDGRWLLLASANPSNLPVDQQGRPVRSSDLMLWNLVERRLERTFPGIEAGSVQFSRDGERILLTNRAFAAGSRLEEWSLTATSPGWTLLPQEQILSTAEYGPDPDQVILNFVDGVAIAHRSDGTLSPMLPTPSTYPASAPSPDGRFLATSGPMLWRMSDLAEIWSEAPVPIPYVAPSGRDSSVTFSPDGRLLLVSDFFPGTVTSGYWIGEGEYATETAVYDAGSGALRRDLKLGMKRRPSFSSDGKWILGADLVWEMASRRVVTLYDERPVVSMSAFAPDGTIVVARDDGIADLFCPR